VTAYLERAWHEMERGLGVSIGGRERDALFARYREPHRAYHDLSHVEACLRALEVHRALASRPAEVACALFFHDAILEPGRSGDEARSAALAREVLERAGLGDAAIARIEAAIAATAGHHHAPDPDAALVLDLDLGILATPPALFDEYEDRVRREHAAVPDDAFAAGRAAFVRSMLARPRIFHRDQLARQWEPRARANLERSLARWEH
jgi:predicted metal-dependent HD superfamily phosphohydrolase